MMQAIGMVNDHITSCFRHKELKNNACITLKNRKTDSTT
jgi:hypothetical protein